MRLAPTTLVLLALLAACGKAGNPTPPVPQIPKATTDLLVAQQGPTIVLTWSFPAMTTAGTNLPDIQSIRVYRTTEDLPATLIRAETSAEAGAGRDVQVQPRTAALFERIPLLPVPQFRKLQSEVARFAGDGISAATVGSKIIFYDRPPFRTDDGRPVRLTYAVATSGPDGEVSELSNLASIVPLDVPLPPRRLAATAEAESVNLTWAPPLQTLTGETPQFAGYRIYRVPPASDPVVLSEPLNEQPVEATSYRDTPPFGPYRYIVTAVVDAGETRIESEPVALSSAVEFVDKIPPPVPTGVTTLREDVAIRVLWDPVQAPDLAGYRIYRQTDRGRVSLQYEPINETMFRDTRLEPRETYIYSVSSVDTSGNESALSEAAPVLSPRQ